MNVSEIAKALEDLSPEDALALTDTLARLQERAAKGNRVGGCLEASVCKWCRNMRDSSMYAFIPSSSPKLTCPNRTLSAHRPGARAVDLGMGVGTAPGCLYW